MTIMKKVLVIMCMLLSLGMFSACSSDDEINNESTICLNSIDEINNIDEISAFFKSAFATEGRDIFDFKKNLSNDENPCILINNEEEFKETYTGELSLPTIDFSQYSLVIGKVYLAAGTFIESVNFTSINSAKAILSINCIIDNKGAYIGTIGYVYYWKIFPKFHTSKIYVGINKRTED